MKVSGATNLVIDQVSLQLDLNYTVDLPPFRVDVSTHTVNNNLHILARKRKESGLATQDQSWHKMTWVMDKAAVRARHRTNTRNGEGPPSVVFF